jgi:ribosomal protein L40E
MIKCQECEAENLLGAIFCRSCGARLQIENLRPDEIRAKPASARGLTIAGRAVTLLLLILALALLVGLFLPAPGRSRGALAEGDMTRVTAQYDRMRMPVVRGRAREYAFTSEEITALANTALGLPAAAAASGLRLSPEHLSVDLLSSGYVRLALKSRLLGRIPVYSGLVGLFRADPQGGVSFQLFSASAGRVGLPAALSHVVVNRFRPLVDGQNDANALRNRVTALDVGDNSVRITIGK